MDFCEQLRKQLRFLTTSCDQYDAGDTDEAVRIATVLRVLFHDTRASTSLLSHLGAKHIRLLSTCERIPPGASFWTNLTNMTLNPANFVADFTPKLDAARTKSVVPFAKWWSDEIVYLLRDGGVEFTRKDLVLAAADKDGGAHVDKALEWRYQKLTEGAGWSITLNEPTGPISFPFKYAHLAALRQMGYEVLMSDDIAKLQED